MLGLSYTSSPEDEEDEDEDEGEDDGGGEVNSFLNNVKNVGFPKYDTYQLRAPGEGGGPPPGPCAAAQTHNILQQKAMITVMITVIVMVMMGSHVASRSDVLQQNGLPQQEHC